MLTASIEREGADPPPLVFSTRSVLLYLLAVTALGGLGTWLAYSWSPAWTGWSGSIAWARDVIRLSISAMLCLFGFWALEALAGSGARWRGVRLSRYERGAAVLLAAILLVLIPLVLAPSFVRGLEPLGLGGLGWKDIYLPYAPYYVYMVAFWVGMAFPLLLVMSRRIPHDLRSYRARAADLRDTEPHGERVVTVEELEVHALAFEDLVAFQKRMAERYIPIALVIAFGLLYEQLTASMTTTTGTAQEISKVALWVLLGPALLVGLVVVMVGYEQSFRTYERALDACIHRKVSDEAGRELVRRARELREKLTWDRSPATFVFSVVKSATISIPLLLGLSAYVIQTLSATQDWLNVFLPQPVLELLRDLYCTKDCS